jgi:hypothetical protein
MKRSTFTRTAGAAAIAVAVAVPLGALAALANTDRPKPNAAPAGSEAKPSPTTTSPVKPVVLEAKANDKANDKNSDNGHGSFSIEGVVTDLYPGAQKSLTLTVANSENQDLKVTSINVTVGNSNKAGCLASNVVATSFSGAFVVAKHTSVTRQLPVRMIASPAASCQGATFPLQYDGTAVKA